MQREIGLWIWKSAAVSATADAAQYDPRWMTVPGGMGAPVSAVRLSIFVADGCFVRRIGNPFLNGIILLPLLELPSTAGRSRRDQRLESARSMTLDFAAARTSC